MPNNRENEVGALWLKKSEKDGSAFFSGKLNVNGEQIDVVVFKNSFKQPGEKSPDYRIYKSQPREGFASQPAKTQKYATPYSTPSSRITKEDDIPF